MTKVSIIIPVHNAEPYLRQCMESVVNQTLQEIEVICVDDGSTDRSLEILRSYQAKDPRIQVISHDIDEGCMMARKAGTMAATGEYIMHLDTDDYLELEACELLYQKIAKEKVDILHFNSRVVSGGSLSEQEEKNLQNQLRPFSHRLKDAQILEEFCNKKSFCQNWMKIYRTSVCKQAYSEMEDRFQVMAEDYYAFFLIAYHAKSYLGWNSPVLYNRCIRKRETEFSTVNLEKFQKICSQANVADSLEKFCQAHDIWNQYGQAITTQRQCWLRGCVRTWMEKLPSEYGTKGMELMLSYWGAEDTITAVADMFWDQRIQVARRLTELPKYPLKERKIKTVAFYYWTLGVGGIERVISILAPMLAERGYRVVVITDDEPSDGDFPMPDTVTRVKIENWQYPTHHNISSRIAAWKQILKTYEIDVVLYQAWISHMLLWDMLYLKSINVPVVVHCHGGFSYPMALAIPQFVELHYVLPIADVLVTMSIADQAYYSVYHNNVFCIPNPISQSLVDADPTDGSEHSVVWVGRNSDEKQPEYVFPIMRSVVAEIPDAKIYLVGDFSHDRWQRMAKKYGLENSIVFCGKTHDVNQYYHRASVFLSTSQFEGFPMALLEAQAHGLPAVIFDLPNIMAAKPGQGVIPVEMNEYVSAACAIVKLLSNRDIWQKHSSDSRRFFQKMLHYDVCQEWVDLLSGVTRRAEPTEAMTDLCNVFVENYYQGLQFTEKRFSNLNNMSAVEHKGSYKLGCFITYIPRKIWGGIRCVNENGFSYTFRLFLTKVKNKFGKIFLGWDV